MPARSAAAPLEDSRCRSGAPTAVQCRAARATESPPEPPRSGVTRASGGSTMVDATPPVALSGCYGGNHDTTAGRRRSPARSGVGEHAARAPWPSTAALSGGRAARHACAVHPTRGGADDTAQGPPLTRRFFGVAWTLSVAPGHTGVSAHSSPVLRHTSVRHCRAPASALATPGSDPPRCIQAVAPPEPAVSDDASTAIGTPLPVDPQATGHPHPAAIV